MRRWRALHARRSAARQPRAHLHVSTRTVFIIIWPSGLRLCVSWLQRPPTRRRCVHNPHHSVVNEESQKLDLRVIMVLVLLWDIACVAGDAGRHGAAGRWRSGDGACEYTHIHPSRSHHHNMIHTHASDTSNPRHSMIRRVQLT